MALSVHAQYSGRSFTEKIVYDNTRSIDRETAEMDSFTISPNGRHFAYFTYVSAEVMRSEEKRIKEALREKANVDAGDLAKTISRLTTGRGTRIVWDGEKKFLHPVYVESSLIFSPDGSHLAYVAWEKTNFWVVVDGTEHEKHYAGVTDLIFSSNGKSVAYWTSFYTRPGSKTTRFSVVVNGREQKSYKEILENPFSKRAVFQTPETCEPTGFRPRLLFDATGDRLAYAATDGTNSYVIVDGQEAGPYADFGDIGTEEYDIADLNFSPDGKHFAYAAWRSNQSILVWDKTIHTGKPMVVAGSLIFSPDSQHIAYIRKGKTQAVYLDGERQTTYREIKKHSLTFSPDSKQLGYVAVNNDGRACVVINGKEQKKFPGIAKGPVFSSDSQRIAYVAQGARKKENANRREEFLIVDGNEENVAGEIVLGPTFSPDSKRLAYVATRNSLQRVVVDGKEVGSTDEVKFFWFSPNGKRYAFIASRKKAGYDSLVVDGQLHPFRGNPSTFRFTDDSKHYLVVNRDATTLLNTFVEVDGRRGRVYEKIFPACRPAIHFDGVNQFHYFGERGGKIYFTEEKLVDNNQP